jgi:alpha-mannosidase
MYYVWKTVILKGSFIYEFSLYPFEGKWNEADLHRRALEYSFSCLTNVAEKGTGKSGTRVQLFDISSSDVILSALYTVNRMPLIRFYESRGAGGELNLHYLQGSDNFTEVDLLGNEKGKSNSPVTFNPWQIRTLMLRNINRRE